MKAWSLREGLWLSRGDKQRLSLIRVGLLLRTVVLWRIGLIIVPSIYIILQRIVKNRGIIMVRICTWIIRSFLMTWSSRWTLSIHVLPLDCHHGAI